VQAGGGARLPRGEAEGARVERVGDGAGARDAAIEPLQEDREVRPEPGVVMAEQPRDWDKELADIDKLIGAGPPALPAPRQSGGRTVGQSAPPAGPTVRPSDFPTRGGAWRSWAKAGLGVLLAAAMTQWPYEHRCGL